LPTLWIQALTGLETVTKHAETPHPAISRTILEPATDFNAQGANQKMTNDGNLFDIGRWKRCALALAAVGLVGAAAARGSVIYDESVSGDLSNSGLAPTVLSVSPGSNQVFGTTGKTAAIDRDYFTIVVPNGMVLSAITLLPGTQTLGTLGQSFIGVQAGPEVTVSTSATTATGLLGWYHYDTADIGSNILADMGSGGLGATDFSSTLPAGTYSFWVQEASAGTVAYGLDFAITAAAEPVSWPMVMAALGLLILYPVRKRIAN
jgi:hypothetical protein